ncbi:hypothetical protein [Campylobacter geochelonis]|uniref:Uncharacterized protein n=1 Tax=Campylobacter geochelonis TaxID=1780362 RepID=A0A128EJ43_9BACT|nr:hypothetical protein [Campylobacter geochelonis]QKF71643.1 hypothetical protein CGEO_1350 [Campylobacter geochelonis]CZE48368.1 Uncharacterised protein [Campylobacter geochelonis]CZE49380.1 Uncharacterised protein [Campylobacter geochelonis]CZE51549.1 Uncharacterised protein [Campylobacter geochelonis]
MKALLIILCAILFVVVVLNFLKRKKLETRISRLTKDIEALNEIVEKLKLNLKTSIDTMALLEEHRKRLENKTTILQIRNTKLKLQNDNFKKFQKAKDDRNDK